MRLLLVALPLLTLACGGESTPTKTGPIEDFAEPTPAPPGAIEFQLPEARIFPGSDIQYCHYLEPTTEDMYLKGFESFQGKNGHHLVLFRSVIPLEPGTVRECSSGADMAFLIPVITSVQFGLENFPEGMAIRVPKGSQLVLQQHYINTRTHSILVRDVARLLPVDRSEVQLLAGFFGISDIGFSIAPDNQDAVVDFDCRVPHDMKILLAGPHMHEWGRSFSASFGPADALENIIDIPAWDASMRDAPPVKNWGVDAPLQLHEGDRMQTTCVFRNDTDEPLEFPKEMCATYGYFFPAEVGQDQFTCGATH